MSTHRVALLEDNPRMATLICTALAASGIQTDVFERIDRAWQAIVQGDYGALVIDRNVPDGDGLDLVRRLRARGNATPCLMVTARDAIHDRIDGLESGADDYLPKPFSLEEFVARVRALMRRPSQLASLNPAFKGLTVYPESGSMRYGESTAVLAPAELHILLALVRAQGNVIRRSRLEAAAWGFGEEVTANALDVAVHRLRRKIDGMASNVNIANVRGQGFSLQKANEDA